MKIYLKHKDSGVAKTAKIGFSWTTIFFGPFVPLFRGDLKWCLGSVIISFLTVGFFWLVFPFIYNRIYVKNLLEKGYVPSNEQSKTALDKKGWIES